MKQSVLVLIVLLIACTLATPVSTLPASTVVPASPAAAHALTTELTFKIPKDYYSRPCQKPDDLTFYDWMATLPIPPYEKDAFDCSQMSTYVEWLSENCNHRATLASKGFKDYSHLWVLIDLGGVPFAYEPQRYVGKHWVARSGEGSTHFHYNPDTEWESIYDAPWAHDNFESEFAWWLEYPELWR